MLIYTCAEGGAYLLTYSARTPPAAHPGMMIWGVKGGSPPFFVVAKSYFFCYL